VSLAAVQALMARTDALREENAALHAAHLAADGRTERQEERIRALEAENATLRADAAEQRARLERLESLLEALVAGP
jgi:predicted nuclease with TOPRIM domain